jgi:diacylglycerol kinase family enzyme
MKSKYFFIINPGSRHGKGSKILSTIKEEFVSKNISFDYKETESLEDARFLSQKANSEGYEIIVAAGGDGTINKVITGFYDENGKKNSAAILGVIHTGTSPDFCKSYGIPSNPDHALQAVLNGHSKKISISRIEYFYKDGINKTGYFACSANFGLGAKVASYANSGIRKYFGDFGGTLISIIISLISYKASDLTIILDGKETAVKNNFNTFVGKTSFIASGLKIHNDLTADDKRMFVVSLKDLNIINFIPVLKAVYSGKPLNQSKNITFDYAQTVEVRNGNINSAIEFDGDPQGFLPCRISAAEDKLDLLVNENEL